MKWSEVKVVFSSPDEDLAVELISDMFYELGVSGVVLENTESLPCPEEPEEPIDGPMDPVNAVSAYLPKTQKLFGQLAYINKKIAELNQKFHFQCRMLYRELEEKDWAESWKAYFHPQKIGHKIVVKPSWHQYSAFPGEIVVEIDPGMAFGTGTHPTTSLCLRLIETYLQKGASFLDVGTGSGILMAAAAKLGASRVVGIDHDDLAVDMARKNLQLNAIDPDRFDVRQGDLAESISEKFQLVASNILADTIIRLLDYIPKNIETGGIFVCSGIIESRKDSVITKMKHTGFDILETLLEENWVAIAGWLP